MDAVESEVPLGFAAVHRLLVPLLPAIDLLPGPERRALGVALGLETGPPAAPKLAGQALLTLLRIAAENRPVLCVIDDAQWLDDASARVLGITARRLLTDRVGMLFAIRDNSGREARLDGLPDLRLDGLPEPAATELLVTTAGRPLDAAVARLIVTETGGNPLALSEAAAQLTPDEAAGRAPLPAPLPISARLEETFVRRARDLPPHTRQLLLRGRRPARLRPQAVARCRRARDLAVLAVPAEAAGLARLWPDVRFSHPLVRSAVYQAATPVQRREAHRALAGACSRTVTRSREPAIWRRQRPDPTREWPRKSRSAPTSRERVVLTPSPRPCGSAPPC